MNKMISIPEPCHEDWNKMTEREQGRHCTSCCKTVVDFTNWESQDILFYLQMNTGQRVCGRFTKDQLEQPVPSPEEFVTTISSFSLSWMKRAAAIFLFAFMIGASSCHTKDDNIAGAMKIPEVKIDTTTIKTDTSSFSKPPAVCRPIIKTETPRVEIMGDIAMPLPQVIQGEPAVTPGPEPEILMGKPAVPPPPAPKPDTNTKMGIVASP